jgi:CHAT domain-containing protein
LKYADSEVESIAHILGKNKTLVLSDGRAAQSDFQNVLKEDFGLIHFAVHGVYDHEFWWQSFLVLSPDKNHNTDRMLKPLEIFKSRINSGLVVLSCCKSGIGKTLKGEGLLGFIWAFQGAGARSVLSSLWPIEDKTAHRFMKIFYKSLSQGMTKGQALQKAKCAMIESKYRHPLYWSLFVLYGDSLSKL